MAYTDDDVEIVLGHLIYVLNSLIAGERGHMRVLQEDEEMSIKMLPEIVNGIRVIVTANLEEEDNA